MLLLALLACTEPAKEPEALDSEPTRAPWTTPPPSVVEAPGRVVAFADVHGDLKATLDVLDLAGLIDDQARWAGGETVVVQTGDQLDRGDDEQAILDLFERLSEEAWAAGGAFYPLLGNHETMNVELDLRYVTEGGFADFADTPYEADDAELLAYPEAQRGRVAAFRPGGPYALVLAGHNLAMQVGDSVFVHGGLLPAHARYGLEGINAEVQAWMRGETEVPDRWVSGEGPVWTRLYSDDEAEPACEALEEALEVLGASRMVVGHTVQLAANPACDGKVWRMDVGMAAYYGGRPAALELIDGEARLLE
ncbi:MAG: metallophosphoesterase [Alphaproteobacteria bacterium]|nr:metallophosphoesterase [Alphaproteobacteria bacterium]